MIAERPNYYQRSYIDESACLALCPRPVVGRDLAHDGVYRAPAAARAGTRRGWFDDVEGDVRTSGVLPLSQLILNGLLLGGAERRVDHDVNRIALLPCGDLPLGRRGLTRGGRFGPGHGWPLARRAWR